MDLNGKRRTFLKTTASAVAGYLASSCSQSPLSGSTITFPEDIHTQNSIVDQKAVDTTLDACAVTLAQNKRSEQAWATIFQKPPHKSWPDVKVAIKVNEVGRNLPRIAVIHKVCRELHVLGVPYGNIRIYAGANDTINNISDYNKLMGEKLPFGVGISQHDSLLGDSRKVSIPEAKKGTKTITTTTCVAEIADHRNDILVNIAVNKGHWDEFGGFTLTMKNHFGTFSPHPYGGNFFKESHGNLDYLRSISKSNTLIGTTPPQQQLCIIDSIWATTQLNPGAGGNDMPANIIVMGVFSPLVDYLTAQKVRKNIMGCHLGTIADTFLFGFGYTEQEVAMMDLLLLTVDSTITMMVDNRVPLQQRYGINPNIPDERVVCCYNSNIVKVY